MKKDVFGDVMYVLLILYSHYLFLSSKFLKNGSKSYNSVYIYLVWYQLAWPKSLKLFTNWIDWDECHLERVPFEHKILHNHIRDDGL